jgi:hypothetical protein
MKAGRSGKRNTRARSRLLENGISPLRMLGFQVFQTNSEFKDQFKRAAKMGFSFPPAQYVIFQYPYVTLFGTPGRMDALIHAADDAEFHFEAKLQDVGGSVDEKMAHIFEAFLVSVIPVWIVWFDGAFWKKARGRAAIAWLKKHITTWSNRIPDGHHLYICTSDKEWHDLALLLFKERAAA